MPEHVRVLHNHHKHHFQYRHDINTHEDNHDHNKTSITTIDQSSLCNGRVDHALCGTIDAGKCSNIGIRQLCQVLCQTCVPTTSSVTTTTGTHTTTTTMPSSYLKNLTGVRLSKKLRLGGSKKEDAKVDKKPVGQSLTSGSSCVATSELPPPAPPPGIEVSFLSPPPKGCSQMHMQSLNRPK